MIAGCLDVVAGENGQSCLEVVLSEKDNLLLHKVEVWLWLTTPLTACKSNAPEAVAMQVSCDICSTRPSDGLLLRSGWCILVASLKSTELA